MLNPPTTNPQVQPTNLGGSARYRAGSGCWRPAARLDCGSGPRLARAWDSQFPYRPRACLLRLPDSLQPFPPVSPERGGASRLPRPNNDGSSRPHSRPHRPPKLAPQPGFLPRRRRGRSLPSTCARLPSVGPRMSPQAPPTRSRSPVILGLAQGVGFFPGSAYTPPLVVLRKKRFRITVETHSLDGDGSFLANRGLETIKTVSY